MSVTYSDFWLNDVNIYDNSDDYSKFDIDLIKLANGKRAVSNFVRILTNKSIPVLFNNKDANMTDGSTVYLSADIKEKEDFDVAVGLALHEGSHIILSDFDVIKTLWQRIPREIYDLSMPKNISKESVVELTKTVLNYVEDRYIDKFVYDSAPGYRGYYISLYDTYFNSVEVSKSLSTKIYRVPTIDAYLFRIINLTNPATDLSALPELDTIFKLIDYTDILRLKTTKDRFGLAVDICKIILKNIGEESTDKDSSNGTEKSSDDAGPNGQNQSVGGGDKQSDVPNNEDLIGGNDLNKDVIGGDKSNKSDEVDENNIETGRGDISEFSDNKIEKIKKSFEKQKKFINGETKKKSLSKKEITTVDAIDKSGMTLIRVGKDLINGCGFKGIQCVVVKNLTKELLFDDNFPMNSKQFKNTADPLMEKAVINGITMGKLLGKKLQIRNDVNVTKFMRKSNGKIDRRTISELGFNNENVFYNNKVDKYNNSFIHISVDASSSMQGKKWSRTISTVVAICKAASMIDNIKVNVSFRTTIDSGRGMETPYIVIAYDSTKDKFSKVANFFKHLHPANVTPEGLTFEAIMGCLSKNSFNVDNYFLNFSDGEPCFSTIVENVSFNYMGDIAATHTRKQVNSIRDRGYSILSYFITDAYDTTNRSRDIFKKMYGNGSSFVNVENITEIAKTMNAMFLKKDNIE